MPQERVEGWGMGWGGAGYVLRKGWGGGVRRGQQGGSRQHTTGHSVGEAKGRVCVEVVSVAARLLCLLPSAVTGRPGSDQGRCK